MAEWRGAGLQSLLTLVQLQPSSCGRSSTDRAPGCGPGGCEFKSHRSPFSIRLPEMFWRFKTRQDRRSTRPTMSSLQTQRAPSEHRPVKPDGRFNSFTRNPSSRSSDSCVERLSEILAKPPAAHGPRPTARAYKHWRQRESLPAVGGSNPSAGFSLHAGVKHCSGDLRGL